jgi:hypothetical protein
MPRASATVGLFAVALIAALPAAGADRQRGGAADRPMGDVADLNGPVQAPELALRRGWLVYTLIDDARDALHARETNSALALIRWAEGSLATLHAPDPQLRARLAAARRDL